MKIKRYLATGILAAALASGSGMAQTVLTNSYTNSFANGGATSPFSGSGSVASWIYWYGLSFGNNAGVHAIPPMMPAVIRPPARSVSVTMPFTGINQQVQIQGTFDNQYGYDYTEVFPLNIITNIGLDVYVDPSTPKDPNGNFGSVVMSLLDPGWTLNGGRDIGPIPHNHSGIGCRPLAAHIRYEHCC